MTFALIFIHTYASYLTFRPIADEIYSIVQKLGEVELGSASFGTAG